MNPVLQRLALRAFPDANSVRPRIASRFDWSTPAPVTPPVDDNASTKVAPIERVAGVVSNVRDMPAPPPHVTPHSNSDDSSPEEMSRRSPSKAAAAGRAAPIASTRLADIAPFSDAAPAQDSGIPVPPGNAQQRTGRSQQPEATTSPPRVSLSPLLLPDLAAPLEPAFALSAPAAPEARRSHLEQRSEPAHPDIHVTIGRIDITAEREQRAAPRPTPPPRPKLMSLEDYLAKGRSRR
ncbi:hypothetical protein ACFB49_00580 [Sphingomonas sp. DBB INV C78]|uniref:hypothetical protein n=1 Tax=Sphingomonas sp. DBB INV C78 TaxID=3349434 RepID=UPI0036D3858B